MPLPTRPIQRLVVMGDAHLGSVSPSVEEALLGFLDRVPSLGDALLINGDLFGFWFAFKRAIPRAGVRVTARLAELTRRLPVLMTGGNHDRWGDPFWESELGVTFGPRELRFRLGSITALATHGDQVPGGSRRDRLKHRFFQSRLASAGFRLLPAELGFRVTASLGRPAPPERAVRQNAETARLQQAWAERWLREETDVSLLIMGHSHVPVSLELQPGRRYLNPGAWFDGHRYAIATESTIELSQHPG